MKQSLQLRTSQHLALTPQLQQSIRLLQLSTLELHQEIEQILSDNPLLERLDDPLDHSVRLLADGAINTRRRRTGRGAGAERRGGGQRRRPRRPRAARAAARSNAASRPTGLGRSRAPFGGRSDEDDDGRPQLGPAASRCANT
jgi:RNA polymerase sigma-54 factor